MSREWMALLLKFAMVLVILALLLPFLGESTFGASLFTAVAVTIINWGLGDEFILRQMGGWMAVMGEGLIAWGTIWLSGILLPALAISLLHAAIIAGVLAVAEFGFHRFLKQIRT